MAALLYITPKEKGKLNVLRPWKKEEDIQMKQDGFDYHVTCENVWEDNYGAYWIGQEVRFKIKIENPNLYQLKVCLTDHN